MKQLFNIALGVVLTVLSACDSELSTLEPSPSDKQFATDNFQRSRQEAIEIARIFLSSTNKQSRTQTETLNFSFDYILHPEATRSTRSGVSEVPDTMVHVVNIGTNNGYLLVSGDRRVTDVLAYVPTGQYSTDVLSPQSPTYEFYARLPEFHRRNQIDTIRDYIIDEDGKPFYGYEFTYGNWKDVKKTQNLVSVVWHQHTPFNDLAPLKKNKNGKLVRCPSGCVATALAQLLTSFKAPKKYDELELKWDILTGPYPSLEFDQLAAKLLYKIGVDLNNKWEVGATSAFSHDIPKVLTKLGYKNASSVTKYNEADIIHSIDHSSPVILIGRTNKDGHAWVSDGYIKQERSMTCWERKTHKFIETRTQERTLLHCNWGWGYGYNGYYLSDVFIVKENIRPDIPSLRHYLDDSDFYQNLHCISNIQP